MLSRTINMEGRVAGSCQVAASLGQILASQLKIIVLRECTDDGHHRAHCLTRRLEGLLNGVPNGAPVRVGLNVIFVGPPCRDRGPARIDRWVCSVGAPIPVVAVESPKAPEPMTPVAPN